MRIVYDSFVTPLGPEALASDGRALLALEFGRPEEHLLPRLRERLAGASLREGADPLGLSSRVHAYFAGALDALAECPVDGGGTPFQRRVWAALRGIPAGRTESYAALAVRVGAPGASRAVGRANGRNPIAIAVPCHRVVASDGSLSGYAGGVARKRWLLEHEGALPAQAALGAEV